MASGLESLKVEQYQPMSFEQYWDSVVNKGLDAPYIVKDAYSLTNRLFNRGNYLSAQQAYELYKNNYDYQYNSKNQISSALNAYKEAGLNPLAFAYGSSMSTGSPIKSGSDAQKENSNPQKTISSGLMALLYFLGKIITKI